jgi:hypothetical protein
MKVKSNRTWILLSTVLSIGGLPLLPIQTAQAQEAFQIDVTQDSATVDQSGQVTISGTVTCSEPADAQVYVTVTQPIGRDKGIAGSNYAPVRCDQDGEPYTISLFAYEGRFGPGRAVATVDAYACGLYSCDDAHLQQSMRLRR